VRLGWTVSGGQEDRGDHRDQAGQPAEDERQALPDTPLSAQGQDEGGQRKRLEGDPEPDEDKVEY
jgi:hypothetical protein